MKDPLVYGIPIRSGKIASQTATKQDEVVSTIETQTEAGKEKKPCTERLVIEPDKKRIFDIIIIVLSFVTTVWAAYFAAFGFYNDDLGWQIAESLVEVFFVVDIILNFFVKF